MSYSLSEMYIWDFTFPRKKALSLVFNRITSLDLTVYSYTKLPDGF